MTNLKSVRVVSGVCTTCGGTTGVPSGTPAYSKIAHRFELDASEGMVARVWAYKARASPRYALLALLLGVTSRSASAIAEICSAAHRLAAWACLGPRRAASARSCLSKEEQKDVCRFAYAILLNQYAYMRSRDQICCAVCVCNVASAVTRANYLSVRWD